MRVTICENEALDPGSRRSRPHGPPVVASGNGILRR